MTVSQTEFRAALLDPSADRPAGLSDGLGQTAGRRYDVYRNNVTVSLIEALETAFPVIQKLVGEGNFKLLAGDFLRQHPPSSPLMMFYGGEMPAFLEGFGPTQSLGYLPDVARLEIALRESYHAADADPIDTALLQSMDAAALMASTVSLAPSLRLIRSPWPIFSLWRFNMEENAPKPQMAAEDVAILRAELDPEPYLLPPGGGAFLSSLLERETLGTAVDAGTEASSEFDLSSVLALLIGTNAMTKIGDAP